MGEADGFVFFITPFIEGESLRGRLDREKQLPVDDAVEGGFVASLEVSKTLGSSELRIESLSTRSYLVTGGDVLLRIAVGEELDPFRVEVSANGADVTGQFRPAARGGSLVGLVQGLRTRDLSGLPDSSEGGRCTPHQ